MLVKNDTPFQASVDGCVTVTVYTQGEHDVPEWLGRLAVDKFGAVEVKKRGQSKKEKAD